MDINTFRKIFLSIILIGCLIVIIIDYLSFNIASSYNDKIISNRAIDLQIEKYEYLKETNEKGLKIILFGNEAEPNNIGIAVFQKSSYFFSGKYKVKFIERIDKTNAVFAQKYHNKTYIVIAGYNRDKEIDYVLIEDGYGKSRKQILDVDSILILFI